MSGQITINSTVLQSLSVMLIGNGNEKGSKTGAKSAKPITIVDRERAALHVLDWLGCAYGACVKDDFLFGNIARERPIIGHLQPYSVIGSDAVSHWFDALQHNASLGNMLEMDDLHRSSILHPAPVIIPAAIAVAQHLKATQGRVITGAQFLDAIVRGYEAMIRIGRALGSSHYRFYHNTSTCGAFGAAAAAASLLGADAQQMTSALANAGSRTGGLWQMRFEATDTKSLHNVMAAQTGVQAAMLAMRGARGPASLLEGACGLFAATAPDADPQDVMLETGVDASWMIHGVSFKPWPACRHAHPAIDAALAVQLQIPNFNASRIKKITLTTYKAAIDFCDKPQPVSVAEAKFSLQHAVAVTLLAAQKGATPWLESFSLLSLNAPDIAALRGKVVVAEGAMYTAAFPNRYGAEVEITLDDDSICFHQQPVALGDPELALSSAQISAKAANLMASQGVADDEIQALMRITQALAAPSHVAASLADFVRAWPLISTAKATA